MVKNILYWCMANNGANSRINQIPNPFANNLLETHIVAGADTTVATLCAIIYYILKSPRGNPKLCSELDSAGLSLPISYEKAIALQYLTVVVGESMLMHLVFAYHLSA